MVSSGRVSLSRRNLTTQLYFCGSVACRLVIWNLETDGFWETFWKRRFRKRWGHDNHLNSLSYFSSNTNPKDQWLLRFLFLPCRVWIENIWCIFRVNPPFSNSSGWWIIINEVFSYSFAFCFHPFSAKSNWCRSSPTARFTTGSGRSVQRWRHSLLPGHIAILFTSESPR